MKHDKRQYAAIHEAGHVVAHFLFSEAVPEGFESVTIEPSNEAQGRVKPAEWLKVIDPGSFSFENFSNPVAEVEFLRDFPPEVVEMRLAELRQEIHQQEIEANLCILLAGEAATFLHTGQRDEWGSGREALIGDFRVCLDFMERLFNVGSDSEAAGKQAANHYLEALFWRTVVLLGKPLWWERVEAVAGQLLQRETLTQDECHAICFPR